jgi:hypothetical protein
MDGVERLVHERDRLAADLDEARAVDIGPRRRRSLVLAALALILQSV